MSKRVLTREWNAIPAADQAYLRAAFDRYRSRFASPASLAATDVSFEHWLSKRGIQKVIPH